MLKISPEVSFEMQLSHVLGSYEETVANSTGWDMEETFLRLSRRRLLTKNFSTEMCVEFGVGNQKAKSLTELPLIRLAGQFAF